MTMGGEGSARHLPSPRGPLSEYLEARLRAAPGDTSGAPSCADDELCGEDFHLSLYLCYELHYRGFTEVDDAWEWVPSLLALRAQLERRFEARLLEEVPARDLDPSGDVAAQLRTIVAADDSPSLSRYIEREATLEQFREFVVHRSAYQLKEADPHSWALPRLDGRAKAALIEIQFDEYGSGMADRMHSALFRQTMEAVGLDGAYGAYLDHIPGVTLATVNLMSLFGLHRRWRGATVGHLAVFEMTSSEPNRRYAKALRRLGVDGGATGFYDEHVEADSVHEVIAAHDLAGGLARQEPTVAADIAFGAAALVHLDGRFSRHLLASWSSGRSSLRPLPSIPPTMP
jgi:Iron-containing redox enzyme